MNGRYMVTASRIRQELQDLERVAERAERALPAARRPSQDLDLHVDSAALSLHGFYTGLEHLFRQIAQNVDRSLPAGPEWHRELLAQMRLPLADVRPAVLSQETVQLLDEYLRFRHVVRNVYAFELEVERVERLVRRVRPTLERTREELLAFAAFLEEVAQEVPGDP